MQQDNDNRTKLQKRVAALSERAWKIIQIAAGIGLACAISFFLYGGTSEDTAYAIYALLLALIVPRLAEQSCGRSINTGRNAMLIALILLIIAQLLMKYAFA